MSIIVSDTSAISALFRLDRLDILPDLYGEIIVPPAVYAELLSLEAFGYDLSPLTEASWLTIVAPKDHLLLAHLRQELDVGEAEAITLAKETHAALLIIDERKGRKVAEAMELPIMGLLGVLLEAKEAGLISTLKPILEAMRNIGFRIAPRLMQIVLEEAGESL